MDNEILRAALFAQFLWLALAFGCASFRGGPISQNLGLVGFSWGPVQLFVVVLGFLFLSSAVDLTLRAAPPLRAESNLAVIDNEIQTLRSHAAWAFLAFGLLPGIGEELLFRGFALRALQTRFSGVVAVLASSALFGVAHGEWIHGSLAFLLGIYLGVVALHSGSVWPSFLCHASNNLIGVAAVFTGAWQVPELGGALAPLLALGSLAILLLSRRWRPDTATPPAGKGLQPALGSADVEG